MSEAEYIVMGAWAVQAKTGKVRHRPCRRWCSFYNQNNENFHACDAEQSDGMNIVIPEMVRTVSECLKRKHAPGV